MWRIGRKRQERDAGVVAIWVALMMPVFLVFTAFAVDIGLWHLTASRLQKAADAAALAGVPYLPNSPDLAEEAALRLAADNGFPTGGGNFVIPARITGSPTRLRVTVTTTVLNPFAAVFGVPSTQISRSAVADYN